MPAGRRCCCCRSLPRTPAISPAIPAPSLLYVEPAGEDMAAARLTVAGRLVPHPDAAARQLFVAAHPSAARYAGFGDFGLYRMEVATGHLVAGFGRIVTLGPEQMFSDPGPRLGRSPTQYFLSQTRRESVTISSPRCRLPWPGVRRCPGADRSSIPLLPEGTPQCFTTSSWHSRSSMPAPCSPPAAPGSPAWRGSIGYGALRDLTGIRDPAVLRRLFGAAAAGEYRVSLVALLRHRRAAGIVLTDVGVHLLFLAALGAALLAPLPLAAPVASAAAVHALAVGAAAVLILARDPLPVSE